MKTDRKYLTISGWIIAILNLLAIINAAHYFLGIAKFPLTAWLMFNACTPSVIIFLTGYFTRQRWLMAMSLPFLSFFGIGGMFVFSWSGTSLIAQVGHILMAFALVFTVLLFITEKKWKEFIIGLSSGLLIFALALPFQQRYVKSHYEYLQKLNDPSFTQKIMNKE